MGVKKHAQERMLREAGFTPIRRVRHGTMWTDGTSRILSYRPGSIAPRNERNFASDLKRAIKKREAMTPEPIREPRRVVVGDEKLQASLGELAKVVVPKDSPHSIHAVPKEPPKPARGMMTQEIRQARYDATTKEILTLRLQELFAEGKSHQAVADALNAEGFRNAIGGEFSKPLISVMCNKLGLRRRVADEPPQPVPVKQVARPIAAPPPPAPKPIPLAAVVSAPERVLSESMVEILRDPILSAEKKVKLLLAWIE